MPDPDQRPPPDYDDPFAPHFQNLRPEWIETWQDSARREALPRPWSYVGAAIGGTLVGLLLLSMLALVMGFSALADAAMELLVGLSSISALIVCPWWIGHAWLKVAALRRPEDAGTASFLTVVLLGLMVSAGAVLRRLLQGHL